LIDYLILDGGIPPFAAPVIAAGAPITVVEKLERCSDLLKLAIQKGTIKPGIAKRIAKLSDEELVKAEAIFVDQAGLTGEDLDGLRAATRQSAAAELSDLFKSDPPVEVDRAFDAVVGRYANKVTLDQFERAFEKAMCAHHPEVRRDSSDDGDVLAQLELEKAIAPCFGLDSVEMVA
jgi:hypothetical protein